MNYIYPAARADEDEVDASSGASSRAPSTSKQFWMKWDEGEGGPERPSNIAMFSNMLPNWLNCQTLLLGIFNMARNRASAHGNTCTAGDDGRQLCTCWSSFPVDQTAQQVVHLPPPARSGW